MADTDGQLLVVLLTPASVQDRDAAMPLLEMLFAHLKRILGLDCL